MFRLIGFLLGSAASLLVLLAVVDGPDFARTQDIANAAFPQLAQRVAQTFPALGDKAGVEVPATPAPPAPRKTAPAVKTVTPREVPPEEKTPVDAFAPPMDTGKAAGAPEMGAPGEPQWHPIWNPFRSQLSARGFAARLESLTGLEYRVTEVSPGSYQVAFAHGDEAERHTNLARIEETTGLRLTEDPR